METKKNFDWHTLAEKVCTTIEWHENLKRNMLLEQTGFPFLVSSSLDYAESLLSNLTSIETKRYIEIDNLVKGETGGAVDVSTMLTYIYWREQIHLLLKEAKQLSFDETTEIRPEKQGLSILVQKKDVAYLLSFLFESPFRKSSDAAHLLIYDFGRKPGSTPRAAIKKEFSNGCLLGILNDSAIREKLEKIELSEK